MSPDLKTILIIDDDPGIRGLLTDYLEDQGFQAEAFATCRSAEARLRRGSADLVLLDLKLPSESGLVFLQELRRSMQTPVIMLTGASEEADRIVGLELGADDYVTKPFSPRELLARVRAVLRRSGPVAEVAPDPAPLASESYTFSGWTLKVIGRRLISPLGTTVNLSNHEFNLLCALSRNMNTPLSRNELIDLSRVSGDEVFDRSVDVLIFRLRQKIEPDPASPQTLKTVRNVGYVLVDGGGPDAPPEGA
ncbi:response regulator [Salipiger abyssi]|uniref:response regulator n=1 Tax=Salipiger abyssi TaxID=1250539 RepID=UPI004058320E